MTLRDRLRDDPRATLFQAMESARAGMIGVEGSGQHMQPMTHFPDADTAEIWFITSSQTDLVRAVGQGARVRYCVMSGNHDLHACMTGTIEQSQDAAKLDDLWSLTIAAWFEGGREDPKVTLLRLSLLDAAIWVSTGSVLTFGIEMARASLVPEHAPNIGDHVVIGFDADC